MDTSEKYILMCGKAKEVQKEWKPQKGDWSHHSYRNKTEMITGRLVNSCPCKACIRTWLPRQDQLQEMADWEPFVLTPFHKLQTAFEFCEDIFGSDEHSMEEFWLAFVMHEKYQKRWDEEKQEWVNNPTL